jgi:hypothetical protein
LTAVAFGREEEARVTVGLPMLAEQMEGALGQWDVAVGVAFAAPDMQEHALGIDLGDFKTEGLAQAQAARVKGGQTDAMIGESDLGEDLAHFAGGENDG